MFFVFCLFCVVNKYASQPVGPKHIQPAVSRLGHSLISPVSARPEVEDGTLPSLCCSSRSEYWTELQFGQGPLAGNMRSTHLSQLARHDSTDAQGVRGCIAATAEREVVLSSFRLSAYRVLRSSSKRYTHPLLAPRSRYIGGRSIGCTKRMEGRWEPHLTT